MADVAWLVCRSVMKGVFSNDVTIEIDRPGGAVESYFVPTSAVKDNRVRVTGRPMNGLFLAKLPTESADTVLVESSRVVFG